MSDFLGKNLAPPCKLWKLNIDPHDLPIGNQFTLLFISLFEFCTIMEGVGAGGGQNPVLGQTQKLYIPLLQSYNKFVMF